MLRRGKYNVMFIIEICDEFFVIDKGTDFELFLLEREPIMHAECQQDAGSRFKISG